jgi:hypothetical protein
VKKLRREQIATELTRFPLTSLLTLTHLLGDCFPSLMQCNATAMLCTCTVQYTPRSHHPTYLHAYIVHLHNLIIVFACFPLS